MRMTQAHAVQIFLIVYVCHLSHADLYFWRDKAALCPHCTVPISQLSRLASGSRTIARVFEFAGRPRNGNGRLQTRGELPVSTLMLLFRIDIVLARTAACALLCHYVSTSELLTYGRSTRYFKGRQRVVPRRSSSVSGRPSNGHSAFKFRSSKMQIFRLRRKWLPPI
jgi:hypothetical protein